MKKLIATIICLSLILVTIPAHAAAELSTPYPIGAVVVGTPRGSEQLDSYAISLTNKGGGVLSVYYSVYGTHDKMACIGAQSIVIEQKTSSTTWATYKTYSALYNYDKISRVDSFTVDVALGGTYRAVLTAYGRDSSGSDTGTVTSSTVTVNRAIVLGE